MEALIQIFSPMFVFIYHCFDRIVINGYISMLSRPENVVHFFHNILKVPCITKEILGLRTQQYSSWVESYARNHIANMRGKTELWEGLITGHRRNKNKKSWVPEEARIAKKLGAHGVMVFEHHGISDILLKILSKL